MNTAGLDDQGHTYRPRVNVTAGNVQALWMGVMIPADTVVSLYRGVVTVSATFGEGKAYNLSVPLSLDVSLETVDQHGDTEGWRASRVRWLDSTLGIDDELVHPFTPMVVQGSGQHATVDLLGRHLTLDGTSGSGLPAQITSWGAELLHSPMRFDVEIDRKPARWNATSSSLNWPYKGKASVSWQSTAASTDGVLRKETTIVAEADGFLEAQIKLTAVGQPVVLSRAGLAVPMNGSAGTSSFQMGLGCEFSGVALAHAFILGVLLIFPCYVTDPGQTRRVNGTNWLWAADLPKATHMVWIGGGTAGMRLKLKGKERHWDDPMWNGVESIDGIPRSWGGDHKDGGCRVAPGSVGPQAIALLECASGILSLKVGETITFRFDLLITPFREPDVAEHFAHRTVQIGYPGRCHTALYFRGRCPGHCPGIILTFSIRGRCRTAVLRLDQSYQTLESIRDQPAPGHRS